MNLLFKLTIIALCASIIFTQDERDARELSEIASSLQDFDDLDGEFLIQMNKKRELLQLNPIEYDSGLIKLANKISFDMAESDELFRPEIIKSKQISLIGSAIKIHNQNMKVERKCFGDLFNDEENNKDCALFDEQKEAKLIQKYGFAREINPDSKNVYIVRLMGISTVNAFKPVEIEVQTDNKVENSTTSSMPVIVDVQPVNEQQQQLTTASGSPVELKESEIEEEKSQEEEKKDQAQLFAAKLAQLSAALRPESKEEDEDKNEQDQRMDAQVKLSKAQKNDVQSESNEEKQKENEEEEEKQKDQSKSMSQNQSESKVKEEKEEEEEEDETREQAQRLRNRLIDALRAKSNENEEGFELQRAAAKARLSNLIRLSNRLRMVKNQIESRRQPIFFRQREPIIRDKIVRTEEETIVKSVRKQRKNVFRNRRNSVLAN